MDEGSSDSSRGESRESAPTDGDPRPDEIEERLDDQSSSASVKQEPHEKAASSDGEDASADETDVKPTVTESEAEFSKIHEDRVSEEISAEDERAVGENTLDGSAVDNDQADDDLVEPFDQDCSEGNVKTTAEPHNPVEGIREKSPLSGEVQAIWEDILADSELTTGDEMDLTKVLHPLVYYITDHEELLNQLFSTVKGSLLASVMPSALKEMATEEVKELFLSELKGMELSEIRSILRGGDFVVTPDLLPAIPSRIASEATAADETGKENEPPADEPATGEDEAESEKKLEVNGLPAKDENDDDDDGFKPDPEKSKVEDAEDEVGTGGRDSGLVTPKVEPADDAFFTGHDDDEKRRLEEALAALEAKEAEVPEKEEDEDGEEMMDPEQRKVAQENEVRRNIEGLSSRLDELDGDAERLQAEGFQELLEADAKDASAKLEVIEKNLVETNDEIHRIRSNLQAQIDAGVRMMNLNPRFVLLMKEVQELIARGRTLSRLLGPMRTDADKALTSALQEVTGRDPDNTDVSGTGFGGNAGPGAGPPRGFQPMGSFVPVSGEASEHRPAIGAESVFDTEEGQDGRERLTWSARWVSSEKVQKVLTHSKVFSKIRQKMGGARQRMAAESEAKPGEVGPAGAEQEQQQPDVIRSVDEYRKFFRNMDGSGGGFQEPRQTPSFDTLKLVSLADQVKQAVESAKEKGVPPPGVPGTMPPPPHGWPPPPEAYYHQYPGAPPMMRPPGPGDAAAPRGAPPGFPAGMPPPWMPPPMPHHMWDGHHPPPGMFTQPPPMQPGAPQASAAPPPLTLPWQQQQPAMPVVHHAHQWPQMAPLEQPPQQAPAARHWPPLRPEDYDQQQAQQPQQWSDQYGAAATGAQTAATMLGSPLSTSDEEDAKRKHKKKHKKEKKKRKKEKKEKKDKEKKAKLRIKEEESDYLEEGEEEDSVGFSGAGVPPSAATAPQSAEGDEEGEIRDDEDNLWADILGD